MTFEGFVEYIQRGTKTIGDSFVQSTDDWVPTFFAVGEENGERISVVAPIDWEFYRSAETKDRLVDVILPLLCIRVRARIGGLISNVAFRSLRTDAMTLEQARKEAQELRARYANIQEDPLHREALQLEVSDGERDELYWAEITRKNFVRRLSDWEPGLAGHPFLGKGLQVEGRMADPVKRAIVTARPITTVIDASARALGISDERRNRTIDRHIGHQGAGIASIEELRKQIKFDA